MIQPLIDKWNADHPDEKVTLKEQTVDANQQHDDLVRNFDAKSPDYDVASVDVVWTAEFAAKGYLQPLEGDLAIVTEGVLQPVLESGQYNGKQYVGPQSSDGGMLYYRTDLVKTPPKTWDEMMGMCSIAKQNNMDCYAGQFQKYEGLTVNASEAINGAGGQIVGEDGKTPEVDSPEAATGLSQLVDAYADGNIPKAAITYQEEEGRLVVRERQAAVPAQLALRLQPGRDRGQLEGQGQVRRGTASGHRRRRRLVARWPQHRHQRLLRRTRPRRSTS